MFLYNNDVRLDKNDWYLIKIDQEDQEIAIDPNHFNNLDHILGNLNPDESLFFSDQSIIQDFKN